MKFDTISIKDSILNANIEANNFIAPIDEISTVKGLVVNAILNYTSENVLRRDQPKTINRNTNGGTIERKEDYQNFLDEEKLLNIDITISNNNIKFDSLEVRVEPTIKIQNIVYELLFNQSSTITYKCADKKIPTSINNKSLAFSFRILFIEISKGYLDKRTIKVIFDKSWSIDNENSTSITSRNISIKISPKQSNSIYYTLQEIPEFVNLDIKKGIPINKPTVTPIHSSMVDENNRIDLVYMTSSIGLLLLVVIISGVVVLLKTKNKNIYLKI